MVKKKTIKNILFKSGVYLLVLFGICVVILFGIEYDRMQNDTPIPEYSLILVIIALIGLASGCGAIALANSKIMKN